MNDKSIVKIEYVKGDATNPEGDGLKVIVHCVNSIGVWGAGFVKALSNKSIKPEQAYRRWYEKGYYISKKAGKIPFKLGMVQFSPFSDNILVCNLIGQEGVGLKNGPPIRYNAIKNGFEAIKILLKGFEYSLHMPRIGCGLAGGNWNEMSEIIQKELCDSGIKVKIYDLK